MTTSILFKNSNYHRHPAFGQMLEISLCCYVKGLELGYDNIYIEWQDIRSLWDDYGNSLGGFNVPNSEGLPFKFIGHNSKITADKIIDIGKPNCLYDGSKAIISPTGCSMEACQIYIKDYYKKYKKLPKIKLNKYTDNPYVLIHYRESQKEKQKFRNVNSIWYLRLLRYIKKNYDIDIYKVGELSRIDNLCDKVYNYCIRDSSEMYKLVSGCKLYIGCPSGPWIIPIYIRKPIISMVETQKSYDNEINGIGTLLDKNQHLIYIKKDNYKDVYKLIDRYL